MVQDAKVSTDEEVSPVMSPERVYFVRRVYNQDCY